MLSTLKDKGVLSSEGLLLVALILAFGEGLIDPALAWPVAVMYGVYGLSRTIVKASREAPDATP